MPLPRATLPALLLAFFIGALPSFADEARRDKDAEPGKEAAPDKAAKADQDALQGKWKVLTVERDGKDAPDDDTKGALIHVEGNKMAQVREGERLFAVIYKLDPGKDPRQIDMTVDQEGEKKVLAGVYELKGDRLRLCICGDPDGKRPAGFKSGEGQSLLTLERVKDEKKEDGEKQKEKEKEKQEEQKKQEEKAEDKRG